MKRLMDRVVKYCSQYIFSFIQAQLVVSIVSIPILVSWGLPSSFMTFFGNLIFAPVLIIFLTLSSMILFTQILHIPNQLLIYFLKITSHAWVGLLETGQKSWLCGFYKPHTLILMLIPTISFAILYLIRRKSAIFKVAIMSTLLFIILAGLTILPHFVKHSSTKSFANGKLVIKIDEDFKVKFVDNGFFNKHESAEKLVDYDIKQFLIKNTGRIDINELVLLKPGYRTFVAGQACCSKLNVKEINLAFFDGSKFKKHAWREYFKLKKMVEEKNIKFSRLPVIQSSF